MVALSSTVGRRMTISSGAGGPASSLAANRANVTARSHETDPNSERQQMDVAAPGLSHGCADQTQTSRVSHTSNKHSIHSPSLRPNAPSAQSPHLSSNDIRQAHPIPSGTAEPGSATSAVPSWAGGPAAMNTELRAKARRQREQSRDKGRDKLFVAPLQTQLLHQAANQSQAPSPFGVSAHEVTDASSVTGSTSLALSNDTGRTTADVSSSHVALKRSSPRLEARKGSNSMSVSNVHHSSSAVHAAGRHPTSQQHKPPHQLANGQHAAHHRAHNTASTNKIAAPQSVIDAPTMPVRHPAPLRAMSEVGGSAQECVPASMQTFEQMLARIPSPPTRAEGQSDEQVTQTTLFVKQYYALLDKCQAWQRYAASMKEKADNLEIENRFLRESSRKNEDEVRALERQLRGLKETAMLLDEERRRTESRIGTYNNDVDRRRQPSRQHFVRTSSEELQAGLMAIDHIPSPPGVIAGLNGVYSSGSSNAQSFSCGLSVGRIPSRSSNMQSEDDTPSSVHFPITDFINLQEAGGKVAYPHHLDVISGHTEPHINPQYAAACVPSHPHLPLRHERKESTHLAELIAQDAAQHEMTMLQGAHHQALLRGRAGMSESRSFPSSDNIPSASLTTQILNAHTREHGIAAAINRLPSSTSAPVLRAKMKTQSPNQQQPGHQQLRHQLSESNAMTVASISSNSLKRRELHQHSAQPGAAEATFGLGLDVSELNGQMSKLSMPSQSGRLSAVPGSRSTSVQSDTRTVTEDYLQGMVEQKRHLRKISLSQQQQMHYLQARVQMNRSNSSLVQAHSEAAQQVTDENVAPPMSAPLPSESRPGSRLSSSGTRRRPRSRAGSYSLHDAIPISKDDVFSSQAELIPRRGLKRSESVPLGQLNLNGRSGAVSALELRHYNDDSDGEKGVQELKSVTRTAADGAALAVNNLSDTGEGSVASVSRSSSQENIGERHLDSGAEDNDPKGAHRRLYIRLREELVPAELVRFERYVHRYDALQIEMEGAKGIINRVRRLLLPEDVVRAKHTHRDRYQFRKELAREFERIVRDDAVPTEVSSTQPVQERSPTHAFV